MVALDIDANTCENIADILRIYFFQNIRDDVDMDNIDYVHNLIHGIEELEKASKTVGGGNHGHGY